jgi:TnpA family transposase
VWVPGSRRYADPASYLIPVEAWPGRREEFCQLTGTSIDADAALGIGEQHLEVALADLDRLVAAGSDDGPVRLNDAGELVVGRLPAEEVPDGVAELRDAVLELLPRPQIAELLIEVDRHTGFSDHLTHAGGKTSRPPVLRRNLYAAILAQACNLGLAGMAEASGISYDTLAWTTEWYLREETLDAANTQIVNHHHRHPLAAAWGGGTLSSSDGQRFPVRSKSLTARALSRYFVDQGISHYTHVSDQHATYGTKVIVATDREATYVLDAILGNQTDLQIAEHVTDTHGQTLINFALFDLLGKQLSPRIRDLGAITLHRLGTRSQVRGRYPNAGRLLTGKLNAPLIRQHWDDLLRLAASLKFGYATASLMVAKLQAGSRQNALAAALQEYGKLIRTVHAVRYLVDEAYQRKITRQLNKGETLHALRRDLLFAHDGALRRRHHDQQTEQALCHTLVTNAIITWNTTYIGLALDALAAEGADADRELVGHLSPALLEHVRVYGTYTFDVDAEWRRAGYRPLRRPAAGSLG